MKFVKSINPPLVINIISLIILIATFQSCSTSTYNFSTSPIVPAAIGSVKVKKDANSNYNISLSIVNLAEAKRLNPPRLLYVVWMETENNGIKNIGQLNSSSSFLSSTLKSSLTTVSSFKPLGFFITAEDDSRIQVPGPPRILTTGDK